MKENAVAFDLLKGISIVFVVGIHFVYSFFTPESKPFFFELYNYLTGFAVPFFFIVGGYFFGKKFVYSEKEFTGEQLFLSVKGILKRVVVPYYIFVFLLSFYNLLSGGSVYWKHFFFIDSNSHGLYFLIIYTYSFLFSIVCFYFLNRLNRGFFSFLIFFLSLFFFYLEMTIEYEHSAVFSQIPYISFFCSGIFVYSVGEIFKKYFDKLYLNVICLFVFLVLYTSVIVVVRKYYYHFPVITTAPPTVFRLIYSVVLFLMSLNMLSFIFVSNCFRKLKFDRFGEQSLFIFLIHPYFVKLFVPVIVFFYSYFGVNMNENIFLFPVILISYLVTYLSLFIFSRLPERIRLVFGR